MESLAGYCCKSVLTGLWVRVPQAELNFLLSFLSTCHPSSTSFYLSSTSENAKNVINKWEGAVSVT